MIFKANIGTTSITKTGMKLTLVIDKDQKQEVLNRLGNFTDKPLSVEFLIDANKQLENMDKISQDQRAFIFALINDIATHTGAETEDIRIKLQERFCNNFIGLDPSLFSLSNISKKVATLFVEYLLRTCFALGVELKEHPKGMFDFDDDTFFRVCLDLKKCCICGKEAEIHHYDTIGMGNDRKTLDDSEHRKIALCRKHHSESHNIGRDSFINKYHIRGIIYT